MSSKKNRVSLKTINAVTVLNAVHGFRQDRLIDPSTYLIRERLGIVDVDFDMGQKLFGLKTSGYVEGVKRKNLRGNDWRMTEKGLAHLQLNKGRIQSEKEIAKAIGQNLNKGAQHTLLDIQPVEPPAPDFSDNANAAMDEIAPLLDKSVALEKALDDIAGILANVRITDITLENPKDITAIRKFMPAVADLMLANNYLAQRLHDISAILPEKVAKKPQETTQEEA